MSKKNLTIKDMVNKEIKKAVERAKKFTYFCFLTNSEKNYRDYPYTKDGWDKRVGEVIEVFEKKIMKELNLRGEESK